jgi:hypothetical protein
MSDEPHFPAGRPPWDPVNGMRVGILAGGVVGVIITLITPVSGIWLTLVGGAVGGGLGYWSEKRRQSKGP